MILYVVNPYSLKFIIPQVFLFRNSRYKLKTSKQVTNLTNVEAMCLHEKVQCSLTSNRVGWGEMGIAGKMGHAMGHPLCPSRPTLPYTSCTRCTIGYRYAVVIERLVSVSLCGAPCDEFAKLLITCGVDRYTRVWCQKICRVSFYY